jgi:predicted pore-forming effector associated with SMODS systems
MAWHLLTARATDAKRHVAWPPCLRLDQPGDRRRDSSGYRCLPRDPQRFWSITARLLTKESSSRSLVAGFQRHTDGVNELLYTYANTPRVEVRARSEIHYGTVVLNAPRDRAQGLEGHYFTDRKTRGEMRFMHHMKGHVDTHLAGQDALREATQRAATRAARKRRGRGRSG